MHAESSPHFVMVSMNQVEQWFSILPRNRFRIADFSPQKHLAQRLMAFVAEWNEHAHPFQSLGVRFPEACFACLKQLLSLV